MKGSVHYDTKSKRWFISIYWEGKRYKFFKHPLTGEPFFAQKSAEKQLGKIRTEVDEGYFNPKHWIQDNPLLVKAYATEWLKKIDVSPNTMRGYKSAVDNYIVPFLGDKDIRKVRYDDIAAFHKWISLTDKGKYNVVNVLKAMLRYAWRSEEIQRVPPFPKLSYQEPAIRALSIEQQELILSYIPEHDRPIFLFMMETGCRPGEARALQRDCFEKGRIIIKRAFSDNRLTETTKTRKVRVVPITDNLKSMFDTMKPSLSIFVFVRENGRPYTANSLPIIWNKACEVAGIEINLYNATRHSLGCQIVNAGFPLDIVQDQLGHSRSDMTKRYAERVVEVRKSTIDLVRGRVVEFKKSQ